MIIGSLMKIGISIKIEILNQQIGRKDGTMEVKKLIKVLKKNSGNFTIFLNKVN